MKGLVVLPFHKKLSDAYGFAILSAIFRKGWENPNFFVVSTDIKNIFAACPFFYNEKLINPAADYPDVCLFGKNNPVGTVTQFYITRLNYLPKLLPAIILLKVAFLTASIPGSLQVLQSAMRSLHPIFAVSVGVTVALNGMGTASAQSAKAHPAAVKAVQVTADEGNLSSAGSTTEVHKFETAQLEPTFDPIAPPERLTASSALPAMERAPQRPAATQVAIQVATTQVAAAQPDEQPSAISEATTGATTRPSAVVAQAEPLPTAAPEPMPTLEAAPVPDATPEQPTLSPSTSFPEELEPDPNPLLFPTTPDDVRIRQTQPITLQQAVDLARRNNRELYSAELELERNRALLREAQAANLPTVNAQGSLDLQENPNGGTDTNPFDGATRIEDNVITTLGGSLRIDYDVFTSGQRSSTIRAREEQIRLQQLQVEVLAEQLRLNVSNDYYDMQQSDSDVRIADDTVTQSQQSLRDAGALERAGVGTRFDVLQAQVQLANDQQTLVQARSQQQIDRRQLAQRLGLAQSADVSAADPVAVEPDWSLTLEDSIILAYKSRAEMEQQLVQRDIAELQRRAALAALGPQVSLFAQYSVSNPTNDGNPDFNDIYQVGAQVNLALFEGGAARARARQQEITGAIAENDFANTRNTVRFEVEQAFLSLLANQANIGTAEIGLEQAEEALRLARLRFQAGVGTQTDVLDSQTDLTQAQGNQVRAILGYNRSLVTLQRAISNLPDNVLSDLPDGVGDRIQGNP